MSDGHLDPKLKSWEASLTALVPVPAAIDRDRLMYEAGRVTGRRGGRRRLLAATLVCGAAALVCGRYLVPVAGLFVPQPVAVRVDSRAESTREEFAPRSEATSLLTLRRRYVGAEDDVAAARASAAVSARSKLVPRTVERNEPAAIRNWLRELN